MFHLLFHGADFLFHIQNILLDGQNLLINRPVGGYGVVLGQVSDGFSLGQNYVSRIRLKLMDNDFQQGGFPSPVYANNGGFFMIFNMKRRVF